MASVLRTSPTSNVPSRDWNAGLVSSIEREETCCYANQTRVWANDPDGRRWEIYTVLEETEQRNDPATTSCSTLNESRSCCAA